MIRAKQFAIVGIVLVAVTIVALVVVNKPNPVAKSPGVITAPAQRGMSLPLHPASGSYKEALEKIETERLTLASRYRQATTPAQKAEIIEKAREVVTNSITSQIFPFWYGTPWDFNGTTVTPGQGKIACGYFVSTVLLDAGLKVERIRLAQQASENIVLSLTTDAHIKRFRRVAIGDFVKVVKEWGAGVYVVGLDIHTGFLINTGDQVYFVHSSYVEPYAVVSEQADESQILSASKYRVVGKVTADDQLIVKWLMGEAVMTRTA
jgi:hypothetical protein